MLTERGQKIVRNKDSINEIVRFLDHGTVEKDLHIKIIYCFPDKCVQVKGEYSQGRITSFGFASW